MIWVALAIVFASLFIAGGLGAIASGLKDLARSLSPIRHQKDAAFLERYKMNAPPLCPHGKDWDDCPDCRH